MALLTTSQALRILKRQGAMLEAARGPLPTLTHAIAGDTAPLLWTVQDVYRAAECQSFIDLIEGSSPTLATNNPLYRDQDRVIRDDPVCAADLFSRL